MKKKKVDYGYQVSFRDIQIMTAATMKKMNEKYPKLFYDHVNLMFGDKSVWFEQASTRIYRLVADECRLYKNPKDSKLFKNLICGIIREEFWTKDRRKIKYELNRAIKDDARRFDENPIRRERMAYEAEETGYIEEHLMVSKIVKPAKTRKDTQNKKT